MNLAVLAEEALDRLGDRMTLVFEGERLRNVDGMNHIRELAAL